MSVLYHDGNRKLQDEFESRRIADRLEEKLTRFALTDADKVFIEGSMFFFLATADAEGLQDYPAKRIDELLPWNWKRPLQQKAAA